VSGRRHLLSAGGVVLRRGPDGIRVLVLHDSRYDEWRLPKGRLEVGESAAQAAEREVAEETGLCLSAGRYLGATTYTYADPVDGVPTHKIVYLFAMNAASEARPRPEPATFDGAEWLPPTEARERLTWANEGQMMLRALERPR
jgi:8-oxo-dGTP pyrophosphatase MutT (NUDIX family)